MIKCKADVTPNPSWDQDGTADVTLKPSCNLSGTRNLPLKHFTSGQRIILKKEEYPKGLVIVSTGNYPAESPATLPIIIDSGDTIIFEEQDWPDGAVGIFVEI